MAFPSCAHLDWVAIDMTEHSMPMAPLAGKLAPGLHISPNQLKILGGSLRVGQSYNGGTRCESLGTTGKTISMSRRLSPI
jgi:hypothetical protein